MANRVHGNKLVFTSDDVRKQLITVRGEMQKYCVEQDGVIESLLLATLANEHCLFIGPPGSNKTRAIDIFTHLIGANNRPALELLRGQSDEACRKASFTFCTTLDKFATPEALLGPYSILKMKQDHYVRNLENTIADCDFAFIGEIFSANGATLRALVRVLNEREIENGGRRIPLRLLSCFADTNDDPLPTMRAVYDRFLVRRHVNYIGKGAGKAFKAMFTMCNGHAFYREIQPITTLKRVKYAIQCVKNITIPDVIVDEIFKIRGELAAKEIFLSDRRWHKCSSVIRAAAWLRGKPSVDFCDLTALASVLWDSPNSEATVMTILAQYKNKTMASVDSDCIALAKQIYTEVGNMQREKAESSTITQILIDAVCQLTDLMTQCHDETTRQEISAMITEIERDVAT